MATGSSSDPLNKGETQKGGQKLGSLLPNVEPFVPRRDHSPRELKSWAKRTGFVSNFSGEPDSASASERFHNERIGGGGGFDLEKGLDSRGGSSPKIEIDPILGRARANRGVEIEPDSGSGDGALKNESERNVGLRDGTERGENRKRKVGDEPVLGVRDDGRNANWNGSGSVNGNGGEAPAVTPAVESKKDDGKDEGEVGIDVYFDRDEEVHEGWRRSSEMKCGLRDNPGFGQYI